MRSVQPPGYRRTAESGGLPDALRQAARHADFPVLRPLLEGCLPALLAGWATWDKLVRPWP